MELFVVEVLAHGGHDAHLVDHLGSRRTRRGRAFRPCRTGGSGRSVRTSPPPPSPSPYASRYRTPAYSPFPPPLPPLADLETRLQVTAGSRRFGWRVRRGTGWGPALRDPRVAFASQARGPCRPPDRPARRAVLINVKQLEER